jgi:hypothetical protein
LLALALTKVRWHRQQTWLIRHYSQVMMELESHQSAHVAFARSQGSEVLSLGLVFVFVN